MSGLEAIGKLREWAQKYGPMGRHDPLMFADEIEREIAERYMLLPVDADGVPWSVGDKVIDFETERNVVAVAPNEIFMDGYESGSFYRPGIARNYRHVKPVTAESLLREFADEHDRMSLSVEYDMCEHIAEFAAKLEAWKEGAE